MFLFLGFLEADNVILSHNPNITINIQWEYRVGGLFEVFLNDQMAFETDLPNIYELRAVTDELLNGHDYKVQVRFVRSCGVDIVKGALSHPVHIVAGMGSMFLNY